MAAEPSDFLGQFSKIWQGGYFEGNPLDPMTWSSYGLLGYNSILYTTFSACIRPYIERTTTVLEIGPGRGAWTKTFLERGCRKVYAVDAAPPEHTHFWDYVGHDDRVEYVTAHDFTLADVPDDSVDFFFSFGVFCHLLPAMCEQYIESLGRKMRVGARGFLMIADFDKFNRCMDQPRRLSLERVVAEHTASTWWPIRVAALAAARRIRDRRQWAPLLAGEQSFTDPDGRGGWYHLGVDRACMAIERSGFRIVERDIEVVPRDPVIHFQKA
jgi:phospholipid N-methyltransferase